MCMHCSHPGQAYIYSAGFVILQDPLAMVVLAVVLRKVKFSGMDVNELVTVSVHYGCCVLHMGATFQAHFSSFA